LRKKKSGQLTDQALGKVNLNPQAGDTGATGRQPAISEAGLVNKLVLRTGREKEKRVTKLYAGPTTRHQGRRALIEKKNYTHQKSRAVGFTTGQCKECGGGVGANPSMGKGLSVTGPEPCSKSHEEGDEKRDRRQAEEVIH